MKAFQTSSNASRCGFSLFEILMFVSVLGIMVSIAVPMLSQSDGVYATRDRRNAQELASTATMARASGLDFVQSDSVVEAVRAVVRGGTPFRGAMKGRVFVVPGLSEEDIQGAAKYLRIRDGELLYTTVEQQPVGKQSL